MLLSRTGRVQRKAGECCTLKLVIKPIRYQKTTREFDGRYQSTGDMIKKVMMRTQKEDEVYEA